MNDVSNEVAEDKQNEQMEPASLNLPPILTLSQERRILTDINLTSNTAKNTKIDNHYTFHNCNVVCNH